MRFYDMMIIWQTVPLDTIMLLQHCSCLGLSFSSSFSEKFPLSWWPLIPPTNLVTPGEICERQAMLIHHQFSERLRNYIFFLPSKYWVSHLFVRLGGQARTRGKQPPKVSPSPQDTLQCIVCLGIVYFITSFLWTSKLPTSKLWSQEILLWWILGNI